jgi:hypothetical protein
MPSPSTRWLAVGLPALLLTYACEEGVMTGVRTPPEGGVLPTAGQSQLDAGPLCFDCGGGGLMGRMPRPTFSDAAAPAFTCEDAARCHNAGYDFDVCLRGLCQLPPRGPCDLGACAPGFACANNLEATCDGCKYSTGCVELSLCQELSTPDWQCVMTDDLEVGSEDAGP